MDIKARLQTKPLSANAMYYNIGKHKKKTKIYEDYQMSIRDDLMGVEWPFGTKEVTIDVEAGLSARQADLDNTLKPLLDTLQRIFTEFNDNKVFHIEATKVIVPKGEEYLSFKIELFEGEEDENDNKEEVELR